MQHLDIAAAVMAVMLVGPGVFFNKTRIGRALRAVADDHQAALSVGISLNQIWAIVWFAAGIVALQPASCGVQARTCPSRWKSWR
jgi:branched-chain amino acid transport system permease protein